MWLVILRFLGWLILRRASRCSDFPNESNQKLGTRTPFQAAAAAQCPAPLPDEHGDLATHAFQVGNVITPGRRGQAARDLFHVVQEARFVR
jgi:hypothetical protein